MTRPIVLIGLMGAGKSSVGQALARQISCRFVDSDQIIEQEAGCRIREIFEQFGEKVFREKERRVLLDLLDNGQDTIIATGGGAFMDLEIRKTIKKKSFSVWLRAELETLIVRTSKNNDRPLLQEGMRKKTLEDFINKRYPVYEQADWIVDTDNKTISQVVQEIFAGIEDKNA